METVVIIRIAESHESQTLLLRAALLERTPLACYGNIRDVFVPMVNTVSGNIQYVWNTV